MQQQNAGFEGTLGRHSQSPVRVQIIYTLCNIIVVMILSELFATFHRKIWRTERRKCIFGVSFSKIFQEENRSPRPTSYARSSIEEDMVTNRHRYSSQ